MKKVTSANFYSILEKDTFYFFISNEKLLELSSSGNGIFYFVDEIYGSFNNFITFAVNNNQLLFITNDSVYVYSRDEDGKLDLIRKTLNIWNMGSAEPWNNDFIVNSGGRLKLLSCNSDSIFIKDDVAPAVGQFVSYPYFVYNREIYKYLSGFGYYLVYTIPPETDPGIIYWKGYKNYIIYHDWKQLYPNPPTHNELKCRVLAEPDFSYHFVYGYWLMSDPMTYSAGTTCIATSLKYIILRNQDWYRIYNINTSAGRILVEYNSYQKYYPCDKYLFNFDYSVVLFTNETSPGLTFHPLEYIVSEIEDDREIQSFELLQNYPNPFNSSTRIKVTIPTSAFCIIKVFDVLGKEVQVLLNEERAAGSYELEFDASGLGSGIYYYSAAVTGEQVNSYIAKKMVLLK